MSKSSGPVAAVAPTSEIDIVLATNGESGDFFQSWYEVLRPYHIIVVQTGPEASAKLRAPPGLDVELFTRSDVKRMLGNRAACISSKDSACRCFGWLVSKKRFIYTLADDCYRVKGFPAPGLELDPVLKHLQNLQRPATPLHFNTLYDPFEDSTDFVRGYPFSLREGVRTVISHGLWLNNPDYDAPTQLVKPNERNIRYVDCVQTIPKGALFPMSGFNIAFDRELIGPAMYFPPIGEGQPFGFHDDMWAGWCSKVICDHLRYGVKSGLPYVWRQKSANAFASLRKEYKGIFWQEEIVPFFQSMQLPAEAVTVEACYLDIAKQVKEKLGKADSSLNKLAEAMATWIDAWKTINSCSTPPPEIDH
ncbi:hypothetical protein CLOP_g9649 [Closterium sp. NIES-67]|nr:hypothetical protein CLOP_g9649 [Closterium sp. NIES-67]